MIWLSRLLNPYVILGVAIACLFGLWKWEKRKTTALKAEIAHAEQVKGGLISDLKKAAGYTKTLKLSLEMQAEDAEIQAKAADQARAKERLAWIRLNKLQKEIGNVPTSENVPVSQHLELLLDELRSAVPGNAGDDHADERGNGETPGALGPNVPTETPAAPETPIG